MKTMRELKRSMITKILFVLVVFLLIIRLAPLDSSDYSWKQRSGLSVHVDELTGCHYLSKFLGGVTPRFDSDGNQVCSGLPK
jgi:hypothetical protein